MTTCPTCTRPVDPLRARAVGVRDGKVVAYCSAECAAKADASMPAPAPGRAATPASGTPKVRTRPDVDSGPVIEILHEPVSGVVTSARDERRSGSVSEGWAAGLSDTPADRTPDRAASDDRTSNTSSKDKPPDKASKDKSPDKIPDKDKASSKDKVPDKSPDKAPSKDRTSDKDLSKGRTAGAVDETPAGAAKPGSVTTEIDPREFLDPSPDDDDPEDQPAAAVPAGTKRRRPGPHTVRRQRDSINAKAGFDWIDDEPAEHVRAGTSADETDEPPRSSGRGKLIALVLLLAGGGVLAYKLLYLDRKQPEPAIESGLVPGSVEVVQPASPPPQDSNTANADAANAALARATTSLRGYLEAKDSPRVSRMAAAVLARTGDAAALARLAVALEKDNLDTSAKLVVAYELARGGDKRGTDALATALGSQRRDDRLSAAGQLAQLGDQRAVAALANFLDVAQHRLGVAEQLARFADPRAIKVLDQIRADDKANADEKARATIALGLAGRAEVAPELRRLLDDPRFNVFAADALVALHDDAARPVLIKLLDVPTLRVDAARALRRLAPDLDPTPYMKPLLDALGTVGDPAKKDTDQIRIAETILLLVGPPSWSERK